MPSHKPAALLLLLASAWRLSIAAAAETVAYSSCECFVSNGTSPGYYTHHVFFDFRQLSQYAGRSPPSVIEDAAAAASASVSSDFFNSDAWTGFWEIENWDNSKAAASDPDKNSSLSNDATVYMTNSASNIYIERANSSSSSDGESDSSSTFLTMRTRRLRDFQTAAELQTAAADYHFLSLRMLARTIGSPGAVTAMFTYRGGGSHGSEDPVKVQEADIEILTRGPRSVIQYTNQPSSLPGEGEIAEATRNATLPAAASVAEWSDWAVHRLDWTPERSVWYVDGLEAASIAFQVPRDPAAVIFNAWSDGGSWSGNMTAGGEASLQIRWIEMLYNRTGQAGAGRRSSPREPRGRGESSLAPRAASRGVCKVVCTIDEASEVGKAALLSNTTESAAMSNVLVSRRIGGLAAFAWAAVAFVYTVL